ncbi:MmgE/PrpD family protein [Streptomyces prasinus]
MTAPAPSEVTAAILAAVTRTRFEDLPAATVRHAKQRITDIVGCVIGGADTAGSPELRSLLVARGGRPGATVLPGGERLPTAPAAFANAIAARGNDFGVLIPYIGTTPVWSHISESTVPAALAVAESTGASGRELITALVLGDDLAARLTAGATYVPGAGWDSPGLVNKFGVAAIAGRLLGLDEIRLRDAFGIVLHQLGGTFQAIDAGAHTFKLAQGLAARDGIEAAELAAHGWTASPDPFFGPNGYIDMYCDGVDLEVVADGLGAVFHGDATFKPYPSCRFTHSAIDCALEVAARLREAGADAGQIGRIHLDVAPMHVDSPLDQPFAPGRNPQGHAIFSLRYAAASALLRGRAALAEYTEEAVGDPAVAALADRVSITGGRSMATPEAATLTVGLRDGTSLTASRDTATGNPLSSPLSAARIEAKFRANWCFSGMLEPARADDALELLGRLDEVDDLAELTAILVRP